MIQLVAKDKQVSMKRTLINLLDTEKITISEFNLLLWTVSVIQERTLSKQKPRLPV